ncbi:MAG TPA: hypothetical protein VF798_12210, partial [Burkholderiaceae bacterium]
MMTWMPGRWLSGIAWRYSLASALAALAALAALPPPSAFAAPIAPMRIVYPAPEVSSDSRGNYIIELLRLALDKSGAAYELVPYKFRMEQSRVLLQLEKGGDIDVAWSMTTR